MKTIRYGSDIIMAVKVFTVTDNDLNNEAKTKLREAFQEVLAEKAIVQNHLGSNTTCGTNQETTCVGFGDSIR